MDRFSFGFQIQGGTEQTASSGKCNVVQAGSDAALPVVGSCIDTVNYSRRLRDETGDDKGFVVVADVLDDLVNVVARGGGGGIGFQLTQEMVIKVLKEGNHSPRVPPRRRGGV